MVQKSLADGTFTKGRDKGEGKREFDEFIRSRRSSLASYFVSYGLGATLLSYAITYPLMRAQPRGRRFVNVSAFFLGSFYGITASSKSFLADYLSLEHLQGARELREKLRTRFPQDSILLKAEKNLAAKRSKSRSSEYSLESNLDEEQPFPVTDFTNQEGSDLPSGLKSKTQDKTLKEQTLSGTENFAERPPDLQSLGGKSSSKKDSNNASKSFHGDDAFGDWDGSGELKSDLERKKSAERTWDDVRAEYLKRKQQQN